VFCQNYQISSNNLGKEISVTRLAQIFKELEEKGAHNINLVTPTHYINQIIEALEIYRPKIPIVYNTNSYESTESLQKISKYVDIFLPDLKYYSQDLSIALSHAPNYFDIATKNILQMLKSQPKIIIDKNGIMQKGVIIRHLVLPNCTDDSKKILEWINKNASNALTSVMGQYTPYFKACENALINRKLTPLEYKIVLKKVKQLKLKGFVQELSSADKDFIPNFNFKGV
jgi:putative pyruvate formate lyase activating enzyme